LDIDYLERIECEQDDIFYIRSIIAYQEYSNPESRKRYGGKAATYLNGIYRYDGLRYRPLCELEGDHEKNGFGKLHKTNSGGGEFNELVTLKTYYRHLHGKSKQFVIDLSYSPYRGQVTTLYAFDFSNFAKPILNLTCNLAKLETTSDGRLKMELNHYPKPSSHHFLVYDQESQEYVVKDITKE